MNTESHSPKSGQGEEATSGAFHSRTSLWVLVGIALGLRVYHYLRNSPVWCDELWLLRNIVGKNFRELLGPLSDVQAAPPLFLWAERAMWLLLGSSTYAMRLLPLLASCGALLLMVPLGRRCLRPSAIPWAILLLGCSDVMMNYTCDVKPYTTDCFLAVAIPLLFCATQSWQFPQRLALFTLLAPLVIFLSYPGCFILGGLMLAFLPGLWNRRRQWRDWVGYGLLVLSTGVAFYLLLSGPVRAQRTTALDACWHHYPNWQRPWSVPGWTLEVFIQLLEHLWRPTGVILIVPAVLGALSLWRRNKREELLLLAVPGTLAILAAWMRAYPFESRVVLFIASPLALLIGEGITITLQWFRCRVEQCERSSSFRLRAALRASLVLLGLALLVPLSKTFYHVFDPTPRLTQEQWPETATARVSP